MHCDETLTSSDAISNIRMLKGPRAVQTIKVRVILPLFLCWQEVPHTFFIKACDSENNSRSKLKKGTIKQNQV
jgi:hypothetical protein